MITEVTHRDMQTRGSTTHLLGVTCGDCSKPPMEHWVCLFCGLVKDYRPDTAEVAAHMMSCEEHPLRKVTQERNALYDALAALVPSDLREDFEDGEDIILRWKGNRDAWMHARSLLGQIGPL